MAISFKKMVAQWDVMGVGDHGIPVEMATCELDELQNESVYLVL